MSSANDNNLFKKRLKHVVKLQNNRIDGKEDQRLYIGLEHIESFSGQLIKQFKEDSSGEYPEKFENHTSSENGESLNSVFNVGDVLFGKLRPYLAKVWIATFSGRCTTELLVMRPIQIESRFLKFICLNRKFIDQVNGSTFGSKMPRADWDFIGNMQIYLPNLPHQRRIADYLDRETTRIDALMAAKQRALNLLAEKRKAVIAEAVTRGLNRSVPLRESGVAWLGKIPAHWEMKRMKYLFRLVVETAPENNDYELLSLYTDIGVKPRRELEDRGNKASTTDNYWIVQKGDLIVNKLLAWMGAFGVSEYDGVTSPAYDILRPICNIEPFYYHYLFRCGVCQLEIKKRSYGIMDMRLRLYFDRFGDMYVPVPPTAEQHAIVKHITRETAKLDALVAATERSIALLNERRAALISAAVTGQIPLEAMS